MVAALEASLESNAFTTGKRNSFGLIVAVEVILGVVDAVVVVMVVVVEIVFVSTLKLLWPMSFGVCECSSMEWIDGICGFEYSVLKNVLCVWDDGDRSVVVDDVKKLKLSVVCDRISDRAPNIDTVCDDE